MREYERESEILGVFICARTTTRTRRYAGKEHKQQDREMRRHTNLRTELMALSLCRSVRMFLYVGNVSSWVLVFVTDPRGQPPLRSDAV